MKKIILFTVLLLTFCVLTFTSCNSTDENDTENEQSTISEQEESSSEQGESSSKQDESSSILDESSSVLPEKPSKPYDLNFVVNGVICETITTYGMESIELPKNIKCEGYIFEGWYLDNGKWQIPFSKESLLNEYLTEDDMVYAKCVPIEYDIIYHNAENSTNTNPAKYTIEDTPFEFLKPTQKGYEFLGWYIDEEYTIPVTKIPKENTGTFEVYANWQEVYYAELYIGNEYYGDHIMKMDNDFPSVEGVYGWIDENNYFYAYSDGKWLKEFEGTKKLYAVTEEYILISTADDLKAITEMDSDYVLTNDIDLRSKEWTPLDEFSGKFYGNGYSILNLKITEARQNAGLFSSLSNAIVSNLKVKVNINITIYCKGFYIGAIAGKAINTDVINSSASGSITNTHNATATSASWDIEGQNTGGILGYAEACNIKNTYSNVTISSTLKTGTRTMNIGGLVGYIYDSAISNSCSDSYVSASSSSSIKMAVGGLVGYQKLGKIEKSYAKGSVTSNSTSSGLSFSSAGGLVGIVYSSPIDQCYSTCTVHSILTQSSTTSLGEVYAGGLVGSEDFDPTGSNMGYSSEPISNSYYNGTVKATINSQTNSTARAGGILGNSKKSPEIINCYVRGSIISSAKTTTTGKTATSISSGIGGVKAKNSYIDVTLSSISTTPNATSTTEREYTNKFSADENENCHVYDEDTVTLEFFTQTLAWSEDVWILNESTTHPTLKNVGLITQ